MKIKAEMPLEFVSRCVQYWNKCPRVLKETINFKIFFM